MKDRTLDTYLSSLAPASQSCSPPSNQSSSASASIPGICTITTYYLHQQVQTESSGFYIEKNFYFPPVNSSFPISCQLSHSIIHHPSITHSLTIFAPVPSSYAVSCSTPTWWPTHPGPAIRNCPPSGSTTEQLNCQKF